MSDHAIQGGLVQTWVPVTDAQGRTRLEARWAPAGTPAPAIHVGAAA